MVAHERWAASAPAKVILLGEHAVNRGQPALVTAVDLRAHCTAGPGANGRFALRSGDRDRGLSLDELRRLRAEVDALRAAGKTEAIRAWARAEFFAPAAYVLATFLADYPLPGLVITWQSAIPIGSGLGSGAAASSALVLALCGAAEIVLPARERATLAWQGDIIAHGGIASGLDSSGATMGGVVRYSVADGPRPLPPCPPLPVVVGDTGVRASTADVNGRVRAWLEANPAGMGIFDRIGALVDGAQRAVATGDLPALGAAMDRNQALLAEIGVSSPEIERLVGAARGAGALGAKLSGSGGGGIIVALCPPERLAAVAAAIEAAGGRAMITRAGAEGARAEPPAAEPHPTGDSGSGAR